MSDREQSRPPPSGVDLDAALRETFACQLRPQEREALSAMCAVVLTLAREAALVFPGHTPTTLREIRAVAADLRFAEAFLRDMSADQSRTESRQEVLACANVGHLVPHVGRVAASVEAVADAW